jgi:uncharacterized membrane protein YcgQ (UPF0703/DUF1980 family)
MEVKTYTNYEYKVLIFFIMLSASILIFIMVLLFIKGTIEFTFLGVCAWISSATVLSITFNKK